MKMFQTRRCVVLLLFIVVVMLVALNIRTSRTVLGDRQIEWLSNDKGMAAAFNNKVMEAREMNWRDLIPKNPLFGNGNGSEDPNVMPEFLLDDSENGVVMGKMPNETLKAQLGQSTWYFLHVMASRYPVDPTRNEQDTMRFFLRGLSRLYPCGQCAHHIQQHFKKDPPRVGSRDELEQYLCNFHNEVNKRLKKPLFDCKTVHDHYDCGCGPDLVRYKPEEDEKDS